MKKLVVDGVEFVYNCIHMQNCWAYKNGGCVGNHSKCYAAPQESAEAGEQQATTVCKNKVG
jgi:hypothetical protein